MALILRRNGGVVRRDGSSVKALALLILDVGINPLYCGGYCGSLTSTSRLRKYPAIKVEHRVIIEFHVDYIRVYLIFFVLF